LATPKRSRAALLPSAVELPQAPALSSAGALYVLARVLPGTLWDERASLAQPGRHRQPDCAMTSTLSPITHPGFACLDLSPTAEFDLPPEDLGANIPSGVNRNEWRMLVDQARTNDMLAVAQAHGPRLRRSGHGREFVGPCPVCSTGHDRFAINLRK